MQVDGHGNVAAAFTADRCIIAYIEKRGRITTKEQAWTLPYDGITGIELRQASDNLWNNPYLGHLILSTSFGVLYFNSWLTNRYEQFVPEQACAAVTELVTKYKQARYAAQQAAAPQYSYQAPPPQAPQAAAPAAGGMSAETVEALKQLKDLLDAGILTQEEFDAKKKQLLGL